MPTIEEIIAQQEEQARSPIEEMVRAEKEAEAQAKLGRMFEPMQRMNQAASRFVPDAMEAYDDTVEMLSHPWETAKAVGGAVGDFVKHGQRGMVEKTSEALSGLTTDKVLDTVTEHPFDTTMLFHGGLTAAGKAPIKTAIDASKRGTGAVSDRMMRSSVGIPKSTLDEGLELSRFAAREKLTPTEGNLRRIDRNVDLLNEQLNDMVRAAEHQTIPVDQVMERLYRLRQKYANDIDAYENVAKIEKKMDEMWERYGGRELSPQQMHDLKRSAYQKAYRKAAKGKRGTATEQIARQTGRAAKEELEGIIWDYGKINKQWGQYAELRPYIAQKVDAPKPKSGELWGDVKSVLKKMAPTGPRTAIILRSLSDANAKKLLNYAPQQVKFMLNKVGLDPSLDALWAAGQFDQLLQVEE